MWQQLRRRDAAQRRVLCPWAFVRPQLTCCLSPFHAPAACLNRVWETGAKVVIIGIMLLGRHRGLPDNIDAAIIIPDPETLPAHCVAESPGTPRPLAQRKTHIW